MKKQYYHLPKISNLSTIDWLVFYGKTNICCCYQKYLVSELIDSNAFFLILELLDGLLVNGKLPIEKKMLSKILPDSNTLEIIKSEYIVPSKMIKLQFRNHIIYLKVAYSNIVVYAKHIDHLYHYLSYS